ncbi:hypothetical protein CDIK_3963 [Cucumispora dikerogammari]|nr:hypothetical protein CDIK_3963 [Cucumispora dikerogammari]
MPRSGMLYQKTRDTAFNGEAFKQSILEIKERCSEFGLINPRFVCDIARIHYYRAMMPTLEAADINIVYLLLYSPFLNPIEQIFSVWKNGVNRSEVQSER